MNGTNRDLKKSIAEYRKKFCKTRTNEGAFYLTDFKQIMDLAQEQARDEGSNINGYYFHLIDNALMAGFMVGYRKGVRDQRRKNKMRKDGNRWV